MVAAQAVDRGDSDGTSAAEPVEWRCGKWRARRSVGMAQRSAGCPPSPSPPFRSVHTEMVVVVGGGGLYERSAEG
jgi:hypothetical protein